MADQEEKNCVLLNSPVEILKPPGQYDRAESISNENLTEDNDKLSKWRHKNSPSTLIELRELLRVTGQGSN